MLPVRDADLPSLALLIGLRAPDGDDRALADQLDVGHVQRDQLGAAQCPGEAQQQQGAIPVPPVVSGKAATIALTSSVSSAALPTWAVPTRRRMPLQTEVTPASVVGVGSPAARWACAIETSRR